MPEPLAEGGGKLGIAPEDLLVDEGEGLEETFKNEWERNDGPMRGGGPLLSPEPERVRLLLPVCAAAPIGRVSGGIGVGIGVGDVRGGG